MDTTELDLPEGALAVGVVKRSDAPLIERLLAENDSPSYQVALPEPSTIKRWVPYLGGVPVIISLFGLLDAVKFTR